MAEPIVRTLEIKKKEARTTLFGDVRVVKMGLLKKQIGVALAERIEPGVPYRIILHEKVDVPDFDEKSDLDCTLKLFLSIQEMPK